VAGSVTSSTPLRCHPPAAARRRQSSPS
jgi:hypothetical protein